MNWFKKHKIISGIIIFLVVVMVIGGLSGDKSTSTTLTTSNSTQSEKKTIPTQNTPQSVFDVSLLVGKNIDEIRVVLGEPADGALKEPNAQQIRLGGQEWSNTFKKDNKELLVTYNVKTRQVVDFFISTDDPSGSTTDTEHLLQIGNLKENDPKYKVEFVKAIRNPSVFTGVKAIPNL